MPYRTYYIGHHKDKGFTLHIVERPLRGKFLEEIAEVLCQITSQRYCWNLCCAAANWVDRREKTLLEMSITREQVDALSYRPDDWTWLDEDSVD